MSEQVTAISQTCARWKPVQRWGLFLVFGSPLYPPFVTELMVKGLYFQATQLLGPANLNHDQACTAITALLGEKADSHLKKITPVEDHTNRIPYEVADRVADVLKRPRDLSLTQVDTARLQLAQLEITGAGQIERASLRLITQPTKGTETSKALILPQDPSLPKDEQKALTILFQREAGLNVLEKVFALGGVRTRDVWGDLLRRRLVEEVLAKTPTLALDRKDAQRLTSLLVQETILEGAPEVLAGCAFAIGQIIEAEIVRRHKQDAQRSIAIDNSRRLQAMANLVPKNTWASYSGSSSSEDKKYEFDLEPGKLIELADALVSLSWRLPPEVYEKAAKVAGDLLVQGKNCLPELVINRLAEAANLHKTLFYETEVLQEKRIPLEEFIGETVELHATDTGGFEIEVVFDKTRSCHSIRVQGLVDMPKGMVEQYFKEIAFRAALLCPGPLSKTIELCFETENFVFTTRLNTGEVLNIYHERGRILDSNYIDKKMPIPIEQRPKNQSLVSVQ